MIKGRLVNDEVVVAQLDKLSIQLLVDLKRFVNVFTHKLARHVVENKLAGQVLKRRTGTLARSIRRGVAVVETPKGIVGVVGLGAADLKVAKYGAVHEYGAKMPARVVVPKNKMALRWMVGNKPVFAKRCNIPAYTMPERSFLRSSLKEMESDFIAGINKVIKDARAKK